MRRDLSVLVSVALAASTVWAATGTAGAQSAGDVRKEVRRAVETHRALERDDIRREEAEVGRRLTPAERAELREQIRYQWLLPSKSPGSKAEQALENGTLPPAALPDSRRSLP